MESRILEDWEDMGRKEKAREGTAVHLTEKRVRGCARGDTHTHTHTHTLLILRAPSDTLFHRVTESAKPHEPVLKSWASSSSFQSLPFLIYKRRRKLHTSQGCHEEQMIFQSPCSLPSYPGQAPVTLHPDTAVTSRFLLPTLLDHISLPKAHL